MRLRRLDLTRYGTFTDTSIDFGAADGKPDLHIIYGANEAGKSTLRAAINDLLFGMPERSDYAFLHDYKAMEIGAELDIGGHGLSVRRLKRRKDDLVDTDGRPAGRATLDAALAGMDRQTFEMMFSLDGDTLKQGGEELHRSRGRLGEALFAATSGLSAISAALEDVRTEAEAFFKPRGKKQRLNELIRERDALDARLKAVQVSAPQYRKLVETHEQARTALAQARREGDAVKKRLRQIERWQNAMRDWAKLRMSRERLAPLCDTPEISEETAARIHELDDQAARLRRDIEHVETELERLSAERETLAPDEALLAQAGRIDRLVRLETGFEEARQSLPGAENELAAERGRLAGTLEKLGFDARTDAHELLLPTPLVSQLSEKIREYDGLATALQTAREEAEHARAGLDEIKQNAQALGEPPDPAIIHQLRRDLRDARAAMDISSLEESVSNAQGACEAAFRELQPWTGTAADLRALEAAHKEDLEQWRDALARHTQARDQAQRRQAEHAERAAELRAASEALKGETGLASEADLHSVRETRDARWRAHRDAISEGELKPISETADAFEQAMAADDQARAARERHSNDAARLRQLATDIAQAETAAAQAEKARHAAQEAIDALQTEIDGLAGRLRLPAGWHPERIARWIEARERALSAQAEFESREAKLQRQREARNALYTRLAENLNAAGAEQVAGMAFDALLDLAEAIAQQAETLEVKREQKREEWAKAKAQHETRQRRLADAQQALEDWTVLWNELLGSCWLGSDGRHRGAAEVGEILSLLDDLRASAQRCDSLERDIARWRVSEAEFVSLCNEVCAATGTSLDEKDPGKALSTLRDGLKRAQDAQARREQTEQEIARLKETLANTRQNLARIDTELNGLLERFACPDIETLRGAIKKAAEKARIQSEIAELEDTLRTAFEGRALSEIEDELSACDADTLAVEAQERGAEIEAQDERIQQLYHAMKKAEEQVEGVGADEEAAALAEERRSLLLEIEAQTQRYLRLMAGTSAAEAALRLYRDKHRSAMMLNAAERFTSITGGRFTDLQSRPDKDGETLVAIKSDGGSLLVDGMSDGTRDQLYLALRMAGYQEFSGTREPLPFIADDVMQTFDDDRAQASLEMLGDVARLGQVIYLTHHAHLCSLARQAMQDAVTIHELPGPGNRSGAALK